MARPPEQAIDEAVAALGHFELVELGAAVNDLREELEAECAIADHLAEALLAATRRWPSAHPCAWIDTPSREALSAYRERRNA